MWSPSTGVQLLRLILLVCSIESYLGTTPVILTKNKPIYYNIYGGIETDDGEFPFMAALGWLNKNGSIEFRCGGMLITSNTVLTAAHCVSMDGKPPHLVYLGGNALSDSTNYGEHIVVNVSIFPEYRSNQAYHDIALIEFQPLSSITPVCLWTHPEMLNNATAIGYGLTAYAGKTSESLLKVNLTVFSEEYCKPFYKRQRQFKNGLSHAIICAGDMNGKKDTCQGDSGGPLIARYNNKDYAIGITSTGQACSGFPPAIYTKISLYINWIDEITRFEGYSTLKKCP